MSERSASGSNFYLDDCINCIGNRCTDRQTVEGEQMGNEVLDIVGAVAVMVVFFVIGGIIVWAFVDMWTDYREEIQDIKIAHKDHAVMMDAELKVAQAQREALIKGTHSKRE